MPTSTKEWPYFSNEELKCPCCGKVEMDEHFMTQLVSLREAYGKPLPVTSGFRCLKHNESIGGAPNSGHLFGKAVDIRVTNPDAFFLLKSLFVNKFEFNGIGVSQKSASRFIHLDTMPRHAIWSY